MLPMFDSKKTVSLIMQKRKGQPGFNGVASEKDGTGSMDPGLKAAAEDLLAAFEAKSVHGIAMALKSAFEICDAEPDEEALPVGDVE